MACSAVARSLRAVPPWTSSPIWASTSPWTTSSPSWAQFVSNVDKYGLGEANFLGGVAWVKDFNPESAKKRFFEIYLDKYAKPNSGIGFPGALELIMECKNAGLKVAVASSAARIKVDANLAAAGLPVSLF